MSEETKNEEVKEENKEGSANDVFSVLLGGDDIKDKRSKNKLVGIYGDITDEAAADLVYSLFLLREETIEEKEALKDEEDEEVNPINLIVSTHGGSAHEMFSICDTMKFVKQDCDIHTIGLGKVMSAGVAVLACGTKGKRKIGKNCRVMIHPVSYATAGHIKDVENEARETKNLEEMYINTLVENTNLTKKDVQRMMRKKMNIYISAQEALEYGIVDEIV